jgi:hypothetical protein
MLNGHGLPETASVRRRGGEGGGVDFGKVANGVFFAGAYHEEDQDRNGGWPDFHAKVKSEKLKVRSRFYSPR